MTFYDKTKSEEDWKEEKSIKTINLIKKRRVLKKVKRGRLFYFISE